MRNIGRVIDQIEKVVPQDQVDFHEGIAWLTKKMTYFPPEGQSLLWEILAGMVNEYVPYPPVEEWHKEVAAIFTGREIV